MSAEVASLVEYLERIPERFGALRGEIRKAVQIAHLDPEMALTRSRRELELLVRDVYQRRYEEAPGTRPLDNLLQRLTRDQLLPRRVAAHASSVRELGNVGAHPPPAPRPGKGGSHAAEGLPAERVTLADVHVSLMQLVLVLDWYSKSESPPGMPAEATRPATSGPAGGAPRRVLWVDDNPENNHYEAARLTEEGVAVVQARATAEAMQALGSGGPFGLVISDMGRREGGRQHNKAGLELIRLMREKGIDVPVLVYSSARSAARNLDEVLAAGGAGITASPVALFELIYRILPPPA